MPREGVLDGGDEVGTDGVGQERAAVAIALVGADGQHACVGVDVFDAQLDPRNSTNS